MNIFKRFFKLIIFLLHFIQSIRIFYFSCCLYRRSVKCTKNLCNKKKKKVKNKSSRGIKNIWLLLPVKKKKSRGKNGEAQQERRKNRDRGIFRRKATRDRSLFLVNFDRVTSHSGFSFWIIYPNRVIVPFSYSAAGCGPIWCATSVVGINFDINTPLHHELTPIMGK